MNREMDAVVIIRKGGVITNGSSGVVQGLSSALGQATLGRMELGE